MKNADGPAKLSPMVFGLTCETMQTRIDAIFKAMKKAAKSGNRAEAERLSADVDKLSDALFAFIEEQLALRGEAPPVAPKLVA